MQQHAENHSRRFPSPLKVALICGFALTAFVTSVDAYACAACGDTLSRDWGTQGLSIAPGFTAELSYSYIDQNQQRMGTGTASQAQISALNAAGQEIEDYTTTRTTTASLNYTSDIWGLIVQLPFVQRAHGTYGAAGTWPTSANYLSSSDNGIGDISVTGRYTGLSADKTSGIIAGIKLPTGSTDATFNDGSALDRSLQIGTGSTDVILGGYTTGTIDAYGWFAQATVQHAVATKTVAGADYHPGDAYSLNAGIRYARYGARFTPMLQLNFIHRRPDSGAGATPPDALTGGPATGGTLVYLAPGALLRIGGETSVYGFVQLPLYQNVNSLQLSARYTFTLGVKQSF
jgi:hypothetical protein